MGKSNENQQQPAGQPGHTPGPWEWDLRPGTHSVSLMSRGFVVMDFVRWGMERAAPRFRTERCLMVRAETLGLPIPGREHHEWAKRLVHPDAQLMADAPAMAICLELIALGLARIEPATKEFCFGGIRYGTLEWNVVIGLIGWDVARAAIAKATGKSGGQ